MFRMVFALALLTCTITSAHADDKAEKKEPWKIPPPKIVQPPPAIVVMPTQRTDTLEVWQHYGVNRFGRFVPRVIQTPEGAYYSRNLQPYPFTTNRP